MRIPRGILMPPFGIDPWVESRPNGQLKRYTGPLATSEEKHT